MSFSNIEFCIQTVIASKRHIVCNNYKSHLTYFDSKQSYQNGQKCNYSQIFGGKISISVNICSNSNLDQFQKLKIAILT